MPEITRRSLFAMMAGALTLDPERLLWTPGKKVISIPKRFGLSQKTAELYRVSLAEVFDSLVEAINGTWFVDDRNRLHWVPHTLPKHELPLFPERFFERLKEHADPGVNRNTPRSR